MNKIKLMYDVAKKLREKDIFKGTLDVEVKKNQGKVFGLTNEFEKDTVQGQVKAKISTEWDYQGKKGKHESSTEFNMDGCCAGMHHGFIKHMHEHHQRHSMKNCCGIKEKLAKISLVLSILNNIKVEEKEDKGAVLSLTMNEIPEDLKKHFQEHLEEKMKGQEQSEKCCCMKELSTLNDANIDLSINVNNQSEIEKMILTVHGKQQDEQNITNDINLRAELNLTW